MKWFTTTLLALVAALGLGVLPAPAVAVRGQAAAIPPWPLISSGEQGPQARTVQHLLRHHGSTVVADGIFLGQTRTAVQQFQTARGLSADGVVGPVTWSAMVVVLQPGASGEAVRALQVQLNRHMAGLTVDGLYAAATVDAVTAFAEEHGLGSGTTVDTAVWQSLVGGVPTTGGYALPLAREVLPRGEYDNPHHDYPAIDLPVATGTRAYASASGTAAAVNDSSCGIGAVITDAGGVRHIYCHFSSRVAPNGASVAAGDLVGYTGNTGNSTGPHLHFGIKTGSTNRCPQAFLLALYDGTTPPNPATLPTTGCFYNSARNATPLLDYLK